MVVAPGAEGPELGGVRRFMGERLARYKLIEGLSVVESIPRNPAGKILRRVLREGLVEGKEEAEGEGDEVGTPVDTPAVEAIWLEGLPCGKGGGGVVVVAEVEVEGVE